MEYTLSRLMENKREFINYLDEVDDLSIQVVKEFFEVHPEFKEVYLRFQYDYIGRAGIVRVLRNIWIDYMNYSSKEMIDFYEKTARKGEEPHYENLISLFIVTFTSTLLAGIALIEYKKKDGKKIIDLIKDVLERSQDKADQIRGRIKERFLQPIRYLCRGFILREMLREKKISREEHDEILKGIKGIELQVKIIEPTERYMKFTKYEGDYLKKHNLTFYEAILDEIFKIIAQRYSTANP